MTSRTAWTRRRLLARGARVAVGAVLGYYAAALGASPLGGRAGIQLYAVKDDLRADPARTLKAIREMGYREVETAGLGELSAAAFRKLLNDANLKCPSAHLQFDAANPAPAFEQAHALGAQYAASGSLRDAVAAAPGSAAAAATPRRGGMSLDEARRTAELANRIGAQARAAGLQYVYHNHDFEFARDYGATAYDVLLQETDPQLVQFEIDCGWMVLGGADPREYFTRYPGRFPMIHVKDFLPAAAGSAAHPGAELGRGMIDYGPIFAAAEKSGLRHYFAEQEGPFTRMSPLEAARQAYAYLSKLH